MELKESVVVKQNKKWYIGYIEGYKFHKNSEIKKLSDVKDVANYITLAKYIKNKNKNYDVKQTTALILNKIGCNSIYILDKPINPSEDEFENYWWSDINEICKKCSWMCKQGSRVKLYKCASFKVIF